MTQKNQQPPAGFNWGKGLTIAIILFITATLSMVGFILSLDYHLVSDDHYERAENYQEHIRRVEQTSASGKTVDVVYLDENQVLQVVFPSVDDLNSISGTIEFYRPSDSTQDQKVEISLDKNPVKQISVENLLRGRWQVRVNWSLDGVNYYHQENIFL